MMMTTRRRTTAHAKIILIKYAYGLGNLVRIFFCTDAMKDR